MKCLKPDCGFLNPKDAIYCGGCGFDLRTEKTGNMTHKKKPRNIWWPNINEERGRKDATNGGAIVALYITISYVAGAVFLYFTGETFFSEGFTSSEQFEIFITDIIFIALSLFLAWRIWKKSGYISAITVTVWAISEIAVKAVKAPGSGIVINILMLWCAVLGVRGTLANRRISKHAKAREMEKELKEDKKEGKGLSL